LAWYPDFDWDDDGDDDDNNALANEVVMLFSDAVQKH